jgi:hypothetical protein
VGISSPPPEEYKYVLKLASLSVNLISQFSYSNSFSSTNTKHHEASRDCWYRDSDILRTRDSLRAVYRDSLLEVWLSNGVLYGYDLYTQCVWCLFDRVFRAMLTGCAVVRLAGGALTISVEKDLTEDNADMIKATYVLVNLGIVPLLAAYDGFLSLM